MNYPEYKVINLTGHVINDAMSMMTYPAEPMAVARCSYTKYPIAQTEDGGLIYKFEYTSISGLPEPQDGVLYIVSAPVLNAALAHGRTDCIAVNDVIRNREGGVEGCKGFRANGRNISQGPYEIFLPFVLTPFFCLDFFPV